MAKWSKYIHQKPSDKVPRRFKGDGGKLIFVEQSRYGCADLRTLRAERGVGPVSRLRAA